MLYFRLPQFEASTMPRSGEFSAEFLASRVLTSEGKKVEDYLNSSRAVQEEAHTNVAYITLSRSQIYGFNLIARQVRKLLVLFAHEEETGLVNIS